MERNQNDKQPVSNVSIEGQGRKQYAPPVVFHHIEKNKEEILDCLLAEFGHDLKLTLTFGSWKDKISCMEILKQFFQRNLYISHAKIVSTCEYIRVIS